MKFGLDVAQHDLTWAEIEARAQLAESLGFDCVWGFDHLAVGQEDATATFEGMTTLAALSGVTDRIRLGLLVTCVTHRHPAVFALQALTVDHASGGRLNIGLGAGWDEAEHRRFGLRFPPLSERFDLLADTVEVLCRLFSGEVVCYDGATVSLHDAKMLPRPVQQPRPPVWIGGTDPRRTLPLAAWYADAWHAFGTPTLLTPYGQRLDELATAAGRAPSFIIRASSLRLREPLLDVLREVDEWRASGWEYLVCSWPDGGAKVLEAFADSVMIRFGEQ